MIRTHLSFLVVGAKIASKANTQPFIEHCSVRMRIILIVYFVYMSTHGDSALCVLLSISTMCTSNFRYQLGEHSSESTHRSEYLLLISVIYVNFCRPKPIQKHWICRCNNFLFCYWFSTFLQIFGIKLSVLGTQNNLAVSSHIRSLSITDVSTKKKKKKKREKQPIWLWFTFFTQKSRE